MVQNTSAGSTVYSDTVVRLFALASVVYGIVGMLVGVIIAAQLAWPELLPSLPFLSYGRLRPLHTNAVIFAFTGPVHLPRVEPGHRAGRRHAAPGHHLRQGIR
jgi:cytochrome c oxidase cbb3-type subunit I